MNALTPLISVCDILTVEMGLGSGRVMIWDQKFKAPTDEHMFIVVSQMTQKVFGSSIRLNELGDSDQSVNVQATLSIDLISKNTEALLLKEQVLMALSGVYAQQQQELLSFRIFPISTGFTNLSQQDGSSIPYRFNISIVIQYFIKRLGQVPLFDSFGDVSLVVDD